jgi:hypothetical protein
MVQASTLLVAAAFVVVPVLAAPAPPQHHHKHRAADSDPVSPESSAVTRRSIDNPDLLDIEAREPNPFSFKKAFRSIANVAKKVAPVALKAAPLLLLRRDEEGNVYVRELDAEELTFLEARYRKDKGSTLKSLRRAKRVESTAESLGLRELDDGIYLEERFDSDFDELDARDPFNFGKFWNDAKGVAGKVLNVADKVSSTAHRLGLREFDDEAMEVEARSIDELD